MKTIILVIAVIFTFTFDSWAQWTRIDAISSQTIVVLARYGDTILAASNKNMIYRSSDSGLTWTPMTVSSENISIITLDVIDGIIYVGTSSNGIFYSSDSGLTWKNGGIDLIDVSSIKKKGNDIYAATLGQGVFIFNQDNGKWSTFNNSLPTYSVNVFTMLATPGSLFIGAGANGTYYRYNFNNSQWDEEFYYGFLRPGLIINRLLIVSNTIFAVNGYKIIRSDDDGLNWTDDKTGSHDGTSRNIYSDADNIYTITNMLNGGTWIQGRNKSASTGSDWAPTEEFLPYGFSYDILEYNNKLFLARADGLYVKDGILGTDNPLPDKSDVKLFPNPSDGNLINISSGKQISKLTIVNILGQIKFSEVVNNNNLTIQTSLDEGVYFIILKFLDDGNTIKKIIIE